MDTRVSIKVHGRGNAWPVPVGEEHPFYDRHDPRELANASYSLRAESGEGQNLADIMVDAGHGTVQSLLGERNVFPGCICLTHGHMDHTLGVDWIVQGYWRKHNKGKPYPLYATGRVLERFHEAYPQLDGLIEDFALPYGEAVEMAHAPGFSVTAFPVYHGRGAPGAAMLLFEGHGKRVLFTGDLLTALLRQIDLSRLQGVDIMVVDSNNRFPWPNTNHWSVAGSVADPLQRDPRLTDFWRGFEKDAFTPLHRPAEAFPGTAGDRGYLETVLSEWDTESQPLSILEMTRAIGPKQVLHVHYSGAEDRRYHNEAILDTAQLQGWVTVAGGKAALSTSFRVALTGEEITL